MYLTVNYLKEAPKNPSNNLSIAAAAAALKTLLLLQTGGCMHTHRHERVNSDVFQLALILGNLL